MNIINTTVLRNNLSDTINEVTTKRDYMLVSNRGKITSAIVDIDLFEDLLALSDKKYLDSIKKARQEYQQGKVSLHEEVFGDL